MMDPREAISKIDMSICRPGMRILVTETTGAALHYWRLLLRFSDGDPLTAEVIDFMHTLAESCEESRVSAVYTGIRRSARAGVTDYPLRLTRSPCRRDYSHRGALRFLSCRAEE